MEFLDLKEYLESKNFKDMHIQFLKSAEVEILLALSATNTSGPSLREMLKDKWSIIIGTKPTDKDLEFIDEFDFKYQSFALYDNIQKRGISKGISKMALEYIRGLWFFAYIGNLDNKFTVDEFKKKIDSIHNQELDNGYTDGDKFYMLISLFKKYTRYPDLFDELRLRVNKKYVSNFELALKTAIDILIEDDENGRFDELEYIFSLNTDKKNEKPAVVVKPKVEAKVEKTVIDEKPKVEPKVETKVEPKPVQEAPKAEAKKDSDVKDKKLKVNNRLNTELKADADYVQTTDKIFDVLNELKQQYDLEKNIIVDAYNKKILALEERIKTLTLENDAMQLTNDKLRKENDKARVSGAEEILSVLNSDKFACVIDTIFGIKETKKVNESDVINMSIQFYNALKSLGYTTVSWGNKIGDIIPKGTDIVEVSKKYRWDPEVNVKDHDLVIVAPGLKHKASNLAIYNAKVEIKEELKEEK